MEKQLFELIEDLKIVERDVIRVYERLVGTLERKYIRERKLNIGLLVALSLSLITNTLVIIYLLELT